VSGPRPIVRACRPFHLGVLMFEFVRRHNRIFQGALLVLIVPSFVAFGIQGYQSFAEGESEVARVAGRSVSKKELDAALRAQVERIQAQMPGADPKLLDTPEMRRRVLDDLVREHVTFEAATKLHLAPTDDRLDRLFKTDPQFASLRNPDGSLRRELLQARGMTSEQFAAQLRQDLALRQVGLGVSGSSFGGQSVAITAVQAFFQQREVQVVRFDAKDQLAKVQVADADVQAYYDLPANAARLQSPETVSLDYVLLDTESVGRSISVTEDDLRKYYTENQARYAQPEERRARHILVKAEAGASADARSQAKAKAQALLAELKGNRNLFAELAKKNSDDSGSAARGGDLDWFDRGAMVKPFEDAAYALKKGELSGLVESEFGFHIIELTDVRGGGQRSFEVVRAEIEGEVKKQLAQRRYAEAAEQFTNLVEQEDALKPVADKLKLEVKRIDRLTRTPAAGAEGVLANPKFMELVFAAQNLDSKRNSEPLELGANQLVAIHVLSHQPAAKRPLAEVRDAIRDQVQASKASQAARKEGEERLAQWTAKPDIEPAGLSSPVVVSRQQGRETVPVTAIDAVLRAPASKLPAWVGVDLGAQGYLVAKISKVLPAAEALTKDAARVNAQYSQVWSAAEDQAYYDALRTRYKASIKDKSLAAAAAASEAR
jgi:peptidyl-prolyl cis-trans isomerase D